MNRCLTDAEAQAAMCAKLNGWPSGPSDYSGTVAPENNVVGYWPGDRYLRTTTSKLYVFNGVSGTMVGWNLLN